MSLGQLLADNETPPKKDERGHSENLGAAATRFGNNWNVSSDSVGAAARRMEVRVINLVKGDIFARLSFETAGAENDLYKTRGFSPFPLQMTGIDQPFLAIVECDGYVENKK